MNIKERYKKIMLEKEELFKDVLKEVCSFIPEDITHRGFSSTTGITLSIATWMMVQKYGFDPSKRKPISLEGLMEILEQFESKKIIPKKVGRKTVLKDSSGKPIFVSNGKTIVINKNDVYIVNGEYFVEQGGTIYELKESKNKIMKYELEKFNK